MTRNDKKQQSYIASWLVHHSNIYFNLYFMRELWLFQTLVISQLMHTGSLNVLFSAQTQIQNANSQTHPHSSNEGLPAPHCYISPSPLACFTNINTPTPPNTTHFFIYIHPLQHLSTTLHFISTRDVAGAHVLLLVSLVLQEGTVSCNLYAWLTLLFLIEKLNNITFLY